MRTAGGAVGWADFNLLLSEQQMSDLRNLAESAKKLPSQGAATVFEPLNIHAEPYRQSPSFFQIPENGKVEVLAHVVSPRNRPAAPRAPSHRTQPSRKQKAKASRISVPLLPPPTPPPPPKNWIELSRPRLSDLPGYVPPQASTPPPMDDWDLVRAKNGDTGWVLARMLVMGIPDEVAQYAEGHRITAYAPLGEVVDKEKNETKQNWVWTTASDSKLPYEFDSFRVFVWSATRHRYETAYIERNVKGYYPLEAVSLPGRPEKAFSLVMEDKDGGLSKYTYAFNGYRVEKVSQTPYQPPPPLPEVHLSTNFDATPAPAPASSSWMARLRALKRKWIGK